MFRIHWRLHGTIGPAVLKSTFFGSATVPECHPQQHFNSSRGAHSLPSLFIPSFPAAFPFCSSLAPWPDPPSQRQFGWQAREFGHIRRNRSGKVGRSNNMEFTLTSALHRPNQPRRRWHYSSAPHKWESVWLKKSGEVQDARLACYL